MLFIIRWIAIKKYHLSLFLRFYLRNNLDRSVKIRDNVNYILIVYVIITFFFGQSLISFFELVPENAEGVIARCHFLGLPFLALAFISNSSQYKLSGRDKNFLLVSIILVLVRSIFTGTGNLAQMLNMSIEPLLFFVILNNSSDKTKKVLLFITILFFLVECSISILEAVTHIILFDYRNINEAIMGNEIRSHSLHGHPLQNAFIVASFMAVMLSAKINLNIKYGLYLLGLVSIFCFNTRSSIYLMSFVLGLCFLFEMKNNRKIPFFTKIIFSILIIVSVFYIGDFISQNGLGERTQIKLDKDDASANARFLLLNLITKFDLIDYPLGCDGEKMSILMKQTGLIALENSFIIMFYQFGIFYLLYYIKFWYKKLSSFRICKFYKHTILMTLFLLLNTNNALCSTTPVLIFVIIYLSLAESFNRN